MKGSVNLKGISNNQTTVEYNNKLYSLNLVNININMHFICILNSFNIAMNTLNRNNYKK